MPHDDKPFRPHLTISRPGGRVEPDLIAADVATLSSYAGPERMADAVYLVASEHGPQPRHTLVAVIAVARADSPPGDASAPVRRR